MSDWAFDQDVFCIVGDSVNLSQKPNLWSCTDDCPWSLPRRVVKRPSEIASESRPTEESPAASLLRVLMVMLDAITREFIVRDADTIDAEFIGFDHGIRNGEKRLLRCRWVFAQLCTCVLHRFLKS